MSTITVTFVGAKGGAGTSTVAVLHSLGVARSGRRVRLSGSDTACVDDLAALLGARPPSPGDAVEVVPGLTLSEDTNPNAYNVIDAGTDTFSDHHGSVYLVVRNDYLSLRRALNFAPDAIGVVLVREPERSFDATDVVNVLGLPVVAELAVTPATARRADAGLLAHSRRPRLDFTPSIRVSTS